MFMLVLNLRNKHNQSLTSIRNVSHMTFFENSLVYYKRECYFLVPQSLQLRHDHLVNDFICNYVSIADISANALLRIGDRFVTT